MKTPPCIEDWNLDNHINSEVTVKFTDPAVGNYDAFLRDTSARGVLIESAGKEVSWIPNTAIRQLVLKKYKKPEPVTPKEEK